MVASFPDVNRPDVHDDDARPMCEPCEGQSARLQSLGRPLLVTGIAVGTLGFALLGPSPVVGFVPRCELRASRRRSVRTEGVAATLGGCVVPWTSGDPDSDRMRQRTCTPRSQRTRTPRSQCTRTPRSQQTHTQVTAHMHAKVTAHTHA